MISKKLAGANQHIEVRILRHPQIRAKLNISSAKLFVMCAQGLFPKPFPLVPGGRSVGWLESDVDAWILERASGVES